jgi:hypothetical protein
METKQEKPAAGRRIIAICPFNGDKAFDENRKGLAALMNDGELYCLYMEKEVKRSQTTWLWRWQQIPQPPNNQAQRPAE